MQNSTSKVSRSDKINLKQLDPNHELQDSGSSPQPQIRIRKEPFKQKPSHDLVKFEEGLLYNKTDF